MRLSAAVTSVVRVAFQSLFGALAGLRVCPPWDEDFDVPRSARQNRPDTSLGIHSYRPLSIRSTAHDQGVSRSAETNLRRPIDAIFPPAQRMTADEVSEVEVCDGVLPCGHDQAAFGSTSLNTQRQQRLSPAIHRPQDGTVFHPAQIRSDECLVSFLDASWLSLLRATFAIAPSWLLRR